MATVRQCDRCKKVYETNEAFIHYVDGNYKDNQRTLSGISILYKDNNFKTDDLDLCDECMADLLNFIFNNYLVLPCSDYACSCLSKVTIPGMPIFDASKL